MTLLQPEIRNYFLTSHTRLQLLTSLDMEKDMLELTDADTSLELPEETKQTVDVFSKEMNSVCYVYDAHFGYFEE